MGRVRSLVLALLTIVPTGMAQGQGIVVDHTSIQLFDQIPDASLTAAANLRQMYLDRSVGWNVWQGLA